MTRALPDDLDAHIEAIPGFLFTVAAHGTAWLLQHQIDEGLRGGLLEIGVFRGKYFAVLARSAQAGGEQLLGIDSFVYSPEEAVHAALAAHASTARAAYRILARPSHAVSDAEIRTALDGPPRFVSVDGSHEAEDVYGDLVLTDRILPGHGIAAIDDFLNPRALGVGEATHRFLSTSTDLVPFALFGNKLFACRPSLHARYGRAVRAFFQATDLPEGQAFRELDRLGPEHVEQRIQGRTLLVM